MSARHTTIIVTPKKKKENPFVVAFQVIFGIIFWLVIIGFFVG